MTTPAKATSERPHRHSTPAAGVALALCLISLPALSQACGKGDALSNLVTYAQPVERPSARTGEPTDCVRGEVRSTVAVPALNPIPVPWTSVDDLRRRLQKQVNDRGLVERSASEPNTLYVGCRARLVDSAIDTRQTVRVQQTLAGTGALGATLAELLDSTGLGSLHLEARGKLLRARALVPPRHGAHRAVDGPGPGSHVGVRARTQRESHLRRGEPGDPDLDARDETDTVSTRSAVGGVNGGCVGPGAFDSAREARMKICELSTRPVGKL